MDNKVENFDMTIDDLEKKVQKITVDSKSIESFLTFLCWITKKY